jgi:hydrogenase maturation protease
MGKTLIVAYGNPLRSDDGLAWKAAEELSGLKFPGEVEIVTLHQPTPELALAVSEASLVLFLDAAQAGIPGEMALQKLQPKTESSGFTHDFSPSTILSLAQALYGQSPEAYLLSMCGECFDHGETLSASVNQSLPAFIRRVRDLVSPQPATL